MKVDHVQTSDFKCTLCKKSFKNNGLLQKHVKVDHSLTPDIKCTNCEFSAASQVQFMLHMESHSPHNKQTFNQDM